MTAEAIRTLMADPLKAADLAVAVSKAICKTAGIEPGKAIAPYDTPPNNQEAWTVFYNDARLMLLETEARLAVQAGETPLMVNPAFVRAS